MTPSEALVSNLLNFNEKTNEKTLIYLVMEERMPFAFETLFSLSISQRNPIAAINP
jgi:hypothetical protein